MKRLVVAALFLGIAIPAQAARVEIRDERFYVDGSPFYVRAVGYSTWRPHQHPGLSYTDTNRRWTRMDFARIKAAHFNTIRTWDALDQEELTLARDNGLMVLQGIWLDPKQNFSDPHNVQSALAIVRSVAGQSKDFDNLLGYLIMTEPNPEAVIDSGVPETLEFFRQLKQAVQKIDPRPVSMDSWPELDFMDHSDFDFVTVNLFSFPHPITTAMGFPGVVRWHKDHLATKKPLLVGETGGYAVSEASQTAAGGFGGLTEYDQSLRDLESLRGTIEGHAAGSVLVSWIDTWHYPRDPDTHDNEPWEWDGILGIPTDSRKDMDGIPRQVYHDVAFYNQLIPVEPKTDHVYPILTPVPIQAFGSDDAAFIRYSLNNGDWKYLDAKGHGFFQGSFELPGLARKHQTLTFQALNKAETLLARKEVSFLTGVLAERVTLEQLPPDRTKPAPSFRATVIDGLGRPMMNRKVYFGCSFPLTHRGGQGTAQTDGRGQAVYTCPETPDRKDVYIYAAAGTDSPERLRASDMRIFKRGP